MAQKPTALVFSLPLLQSGGNPANITSPRQKSAWDDHLVQQAPVPRLAEEWDGGPLLDVPMSVNDGDGAPLTELLQPQPGAPPVAEAMEGAWPCIDPPIIFSEWE